MATTSAAVIIRPHVLVHLGGAACGEADGLEGGVSQHSCGATVWLYLGVADKWRWLHLGLLFLRLALGLP